MRDIFPAAYYRELLDNLPAAEAMQDDPDRFIMPLGGELPAALSERQRAFWRDLARWFFAGVFGQAVIHRFHDQIGERLKEEPEAEITDELRLVRERTRHSLGPHTDSPGKLVSLLFYLPADDRLERYGTSMYVPREFGFTCPGGPHYPFERFERAATMAFLPNSLFAFAKSPRSFHGVEPIEESGVERNLLLYDLRMRKKPV